MVLIYYKKNHISMSSEHDKIFVTPFENNRRNIWNILNEHGLTGYGVEIGVKQGVFSKHLLSNVPFKKLYLVDPWIKQDTQTYDEVHHDHTVDLKTCLDNVNEFKGRCEIVRDFSYNAYSRFEDEYFDFIYIDGNHSYDAVSDDLNKWYPKLKKGGLIAGDDYTSKPEELTFNYMFGVKKAVDEFAIKMKKNISIDLHGDWYYKSMLNGKEVLYPSRNWYFIK